MRRMDDMQMIEVKITGAARQPHTYQLTQPVGLTLDALLKSLSLTPAKLPEKQQDKKKLTLDDYGDDEMVPMDIAFPEMQDPAVRIPTLLRGSRYKMKMTQKALADALGIRQHHLSEMENGKRPIGKAMAKRIAEILKTNWKHFV